MKDEYDNCMRTLSGQFKGSIVGTVKNLDQG